ncbi:hypothetical protein CWI42_040030 [Ordospora colligata]|nr:hypothetical protein CWI42_040030 [Ordospora colligata]
MIILASNNQNKMNAAALGNSLPATERKLADLIGSESFILIKSKEEDDSIKSKSSAEDVVSADQKYHPTHFGREMIEMGILVSLVLISILLNFLEVDNKIFRIAMSVAVLSCFVYCIIRTTILATMDNIPNDAMGSFFYFSTLPFTLVPICIMLKELLGEDGNTDSLLYSNEGERMLLGRYTLMIIGAFVLIQALNVLQACNDRTKSNYVIRSSFICGFSGLILFSGESFGLSKYQSIFAITLMVCLALLTSVDFIREKKRKTSNKSDHNNKILTQSNNPYRLFYMVIFLSGLNVINMSVDQGLDVGGIVKLLIDKIFPGLKLFDNLVSMNSK